MKIRTLASRRRLLQGLGALAGLPLLTSCGTLLYPDRVQQTERGGLDPAIIILDGVGLFFFLVPGVIAFAVDFMTGAIYFPANKGPGDRERTFFDGLTRYVPATDGPLSRHDIEQAAARQAGAEVDLSRSDIRVVELDHLGRFREAWSRIAA